MSKKLLRVLRGERLDPPPIWLMRQAGRYLPEYRKIREQAGDFLSLATMPDLAAEVTLQPIRRFMLDAAILFSDILLVPWGLGQRLEYARGAGPVLSPIRSATDLLRLSPARLSSIIGLAAQTVHRVRGALGSSRTCKIADPIGRLKASLALLMRLSTRTKASLTQRSTRSDSTRTTPPHHGDLTNRNG